MRAIKSYLKQLVCIWRGHQYNKIEDSETSTLIGYGNYSKFNYFREQNKGTVYLVPHPHPNDRDVSKGTVKCMVLENNPYETSDRVYGWSPVYSMVKELEILNENDTL